MTTEIYIIIVLFAVSLTAFVGAINARGTARMVLSYILAAFTLLASVFCLLTYMSEKQLAAKEAEKVKYEEQLRLAEEEAKLAAEQQAAVETEKGYKAALTSAISKGSNIARAILSIDVDDEDADFDALMGRSGSLRRQASSLRKETGELKPPEGVTKFDDGRKLIDKALKNLAVAANYFNLYFKAEDEDEEDERYDIYRANAAAARSNFRKAADKLK